MVSKREGISNFEGSICFEPYKTLLKPYRYYNLIQKRYCPFKGDTVF